MSARECASRSPLASTLRSFMPRSDSRAPSRVASRAASVVSSDATGVVPVENISFVSHLPNLGRGVGGGADLEGITAAAATLTGLAPPRSEIGTAHGDARSEGRHSRTRNSSTTGAGGTVTGSTGHAGAPEEIISDNVTTLQIVKQFLFIGLPLSLTALSQFSLNTVIVSVTGKLLGDVELGGASLAVGLVNATGFAFGAGLCGAIETVLPHTFGAYQRECQMVEKENAARIALREQHRHTQGADQPGQPGRSLPPGVESSEGASNIDDAESVAASLLEPPQTLYMYGIYTQRMAVILFIVAFPLGVILLFADMGLQSLGESSAVLHYTGVWCRCAVFGIPAALAYQLVQRFFSCQSVTKPLSVALVTAALVNPVLQIVFVKLFGFIGSPIAWLLLMCGIVGGLVGYIKYTGLHKLTWGGWSEKSLQNLGSLTALAIPSMGMMLSEWVALEVNALAGGFAPTDQLAAYSITLQVFGIAWGVGSGVMILTAVFVGSAVGARKPMLARQIAFTALGIMFCVALMDITLVYLLGPVIPWIFTNDPVVAAKYHSLMRYVLPYHIFDTFQSTVMGIFRGCEMQKLGAIIITIAFCVIGVPLSFLLFFHFDIGVVALWIGPFVGVMCFGTPCYLYILLRHIKWEKLEPHTDSTAIPVEEADETDHGVAGSVVSGVDGSRRDAVSAPAAAGAAWSEGNERVSDPLTGTGDDLVRAYVDDAVRRTQNGGVAAASADAKAVAPN